MAKFSRNDASNSKRGKHKSESVSRDIRIRDAEHKGRKADIVRNYIDRQLQPSVPGDDVVAIDVSVDDPWWKNQYDESDDE